MGRSTFGSSVPQTGGTIPPRAAPGHVHLGRFDRLLAYSGPEETACRAYLNSVRFGEIT